MYISYEILRNLAPEGLSAVQQREADDQLGRMAAGVMRRGRTDGRVAACTGTGAGFRRRPHGWFSKVRRDAAARGSRVVRPAA